MNKEKERVEVNVRGWIDGDESAHLMLRRISAVRSSLLLPPLQRVPLRTGNVVEIVGPSPSAKTLILIQVAVSCVLPKEWNGVRYGGLDHSVLFIDLDCRFDITRFSQMLVHRIIESHGEANADANGDYDKALYDLCMCRFLYVRCSSSFEFLQTLKTLHYRLKKEKEAHGVSVHMLMIDSIGAFHWVDRASMFLSKRENNRKKLFLQSVSEAVVQDIKKLLQVHPMLVLATKSVIFGNRYSTASNEVKGNFIKENWEERCSRNRQHFQYREYMPSIWQSFVTHRILLRSSDDHPVTSNYQNSSFYVLEWLLPRLSFPEKIVVKDVRTLCADHGFEVIKLGRFFWTQFWLFAELVGWCLCRFMNMFAEGVNMECIITAFKCRLRSIRSVIIGQVPNTPKKPIGSYLGFHEVVRGFIILYHRNSFAPY